MASGTGASHTKFGHENQRSAIFGCRKRRPDAHHGDEGDHAEQSEPRFALRPLLQIAPRSSSRARSRRAARSRTRGRRRPSAETARSQSSTVPANWRPWTSKPSDELTEHDSPARRSRAAIPRRTTWSQRKRLRCAFMPELERDAAEDESEQHQQDRKVHRRNDDREGERKGREQADAARAPATSRCRPRSARPSPSSACALASSRANGNRMPTPRSKPSSSTYMKTASAEDQRPDRDEVDGHGGDEASV